MSALLDYLSENHTTTTFEEMETDFLDKFGVNIRNEDDLFLFKYNMILSKWVEPVTWECRGSILRRVDGAWKYCSRPFSKFFNIQEGHCKIFEQKAFNSLMSELTVCEKADGTCIQLWWDDVKKTLRSSTLGTITPFNVGDYEITFDKLFWDTMGENSQSTFKSAGGCTLLFELCCNANRIVTKYPKDKIFLLAARNVATGEYLDSNRLDSILKDNGHFNISAPFKQNINSLNISSLDDMHLFVNEQTKNIEKFGEFPEGFVIYHDCEPVAKMKNMAYVSMHRVSGGDTFHTRNVVIDSFFTGNLDDIYSHLVDPMQEYADKLIIKVKGIYENIECILKEIECTKFETQKDYAMMVQKKSPKKLTGFFFQNKELILDSNENNLELFTKWITMNYKRFDDVWKEKENL